MEQKHWWLMPIFWDADLTELLKSHLDFLNLQESSQSISFRGLDITIFPGVYHPLLYSSSCLLAKAIIPYIKKEGMEIFEVGCGSAAISCVLAQMDEVNTVFASDVTLKAINCSKKNAKAYGKGKITVLESNMFEDFSRSYPKKKFDLIFFNAPLMQGDPIATRMGYDKEYDLATIDVGGALLIRFVEDAPIYLKSGGRMVVLVSNVGNFAMIEKATNIMAKLGEVEVLYSVFNGLHREWRFALSVVVK